MYISAEGAERILTDPGILYAIYIYIYNMVLLQQVSCLKTVYIFFFFFSLEIVFKIFRLTTFFFFFLIRLLQIYIR